MRTIEKTLDIAEFKAITNDRPGTFEAVVACFGNVDRVKDLIPRGAFAESLAKSQSYPVIWSHQWGLPPIGISTKGEEVDNGLKFKGRLFIDKNQLADEIHTAMVEGALREWSFGANVLSERHEDRDGDQITVLEKLDLIEFGPCLKGVNASTYTIGVKAAAQAALEELLGDKASQETESVPADNSQKALSLEQKRALLGVLF